jgi:enoyl-[acyl-carrier protein] reductase II
MREILGKGRSRLGMFEGNMVEGELEIGQVCANIDMILPAAAIIEEVWKEFNELLAKPIRH